jgi:predicted transcriptional regulator
MGFNNPQPLKSSYKVTKSQYRERVHIVRDILLKLVEYGELNQTALISYCGLNLTKHRYLLEDMEGQGLIRREMQTLGKSRSISIFSATPSGLEFLSAILQPYERMFPQKK